MKKILILVGMALTIGFLPFVQYSTAAGFRDGVDMYKTNIWNLKDGGIPLVSNAPTWMVTNTVTSNIWHQAVNAGQLWVWGGGGGGANGDFITKTNHDGKISGKRLYFEFNTNGTTRDNNYIVATNMGAGIVLTVVGSNSAWSAGNCRITGVAPGTLVLIGGQ